MVLADDSDYHCGDDNAVRVVVRVRPVPTQAALEHRPIGLLRAVSLALTSPAFESLHGADADRSAAQRDVPTGRSPR